MPRLSLALVLLAGLVLPVLAGLYALSQTGTTAPVPDSLEAEAAAIASDPPIDLLAPGTPVEVGDGTASRSLAALAEADPEGAVALVRQALLTDPGMLEEAIAALEAVRAASAQSEVADIIADNADVLFSSDNASVLGNPEGTITLVEFLDYNCGFCKRAHADVMEVIATHPDVRVLVKDFPVLGPGSLEAAQVAIAFRQAGGDMTAFIDTMMREETRRADRALALDVAEALGGARGALDAAADEDATLEPVAVAYTLAEALGIQGTPAFVIGDELIMGAVGFDRLDAAIQAARRQAQAGD